MAAGPAEITLHTYFRSSCSARLRIAFNLKAITYRSVYVDLLKDEHHSLDYHAFNPSGQVPSMTLHGPERDQILTQSVAMLEYLEEAFPGRVPLLPPMSDPIGRARVRALVDIIACDIQPVTNLRILKQVESVGKSRQEWAHDLVIEGLNAYEAHIVHNGTRFSCGDSITLADVCLVPAVWSALRFEVDLNAFPHIKRVYDEMSKEQAVKVAHWQNQPDTPIDLREC